jgi:nucleoside phosphorylase
MAPQVAPSVATVLPGPGSPGYAARDRGAQGALAGATRHAPPVRKAVIFTALGVEYRAIRAYLDGAQRREEHGMLYEVGTLPGIRGSWQLALAETGPGSTAAGLQLDRAVRVFDPEIAIYLGVAGGRKDVDHGDVVVADAVYDCEPGKSTLEGFEPRMRTHFPAHRLLQWARFVARENQWQRRILPACPDPPPDCYVKPIVTGAKVIAHDRSQAALLLGKYAGDAVAVETEGHGFLEAAYVNPRVDALVIRGISDLLAGKDKASDDHWQPAASRHAAAFAVEFLDSIGEKEA